jgi:hypothetical protein
MDQVVVIGRLCLRSDYMGLLLFWGSIGHAQSKSSSWVVIDDGPRLQQACSLFPLLCPLEGERSWGKPWAIPFRGGVSFNTNIAALF